DHDATYARVTRVAQRGPQPAGHRTNLGYLAHAPTSRAKALGATWRYACLSRRTNPLRVAASIVAGARLIRPPQRGWAGSAPLHLRSRAAQRGWREPRRSR